MVVARGLSCSVARGIFPNWGWSHVSCIGKLILLPLSHQGSPESVDMNSSQIPRSVVSLFLVAGFAVVGRIRPHYLYHHPSSVISGKRPDDLSSPMKCTSWQEKRKFKLWFMFQSFSDMEISVVVIVFWYLGVLLFVFLSLHLERFVLLYRSRPECYLIQRAG